MSVPPPQDRPAVTGPGDRSGAVCARHPNRPTGLACTRCRRPMCPDCLHEAPVGAQCTDCIAAGRRETPRARTIGVRRGRTPVAVPALIAVNVGVFVLTAVVARSVGNNADSPLFAAAALTPVDVAAGQWWQVVTSGFLHIGPLHIVVNMIALWVIGTNVETVLGAGRFTVVYLVSLLGGSAAVVLFGAPTTPVAGASGAVFGLMGALTILLRRAQLSLTPVLLTIGINVVISVAVPGISILGHLGGLVVGLLVTAALVHGPAASRPRAGVAVAGAVAVLLVALIAVRSLTMF